MIFSSQLNKLRKEAGLTQEALAEKCEISRQAVAKWESGESVPDIYKISQLADMFNVSIEELIWGSEKKDSQNDVAKRIYVLFIENLESLRTCVIANGYRSDKELATKLRIEIKKARFFFPKKVIEELLNITEDFATWMWAENTEIYLKKIIPERYERVEELLGDYLELP